MEKIRQWEHLVTLEEDGRSLERILKAQGFSKKEISRMKFSSYGLRVDGKQRRSTELLHSGETISLCLQDTHDAVRDDPDKAETLLLCLQDIRDAVRDDSDKAETLPLCPQDTRDAVRDDPEEAETLFPCLQDAAGAKESSAILPFIVYEDEDLIIADKPSGLSVHPGKGHYRENFGSVLSRYCREKGELCAIRLIGRLDRDTSGAVVFAKNRTAAARLWKQRENGEFQKAYLTAVHGILEQKEGTIALPLGMAEGEKNRLRVQENGQRAATRYRVLKTMLYREMPVTLVKCVLETGRTHQIRVHMSAIGHPVLGDLFYGRGDGEERLALHAAAVSLFQPFHRQLIKRTVPPPKETLLGACYPKLQEAFAGFQGESPFP